MSKFLNKTISQEATYGTSLSVCLGACLSEMSQYLQVVDLTSFLLIV